MLEPGMPAPDFDVEDQYGDPVRLEDLRGRWVVLWWYPKADTTGCSLEGAMFRSAHHQFEELNAAILGISHDVPDDNCAWAEESGFQFKLLSDPERVTSAAYLAQRGPDDPWAGGVRRVTYLIDPEGIVQRSYDVGPGDIFGHPQAVLADLRELSA